jgi:hypothetical protein
VKRSGSVNSGVAMCLVLLVFGALLLLAIAIGPMCLAYDINVLNAYFSGGLREVSMWEIPVFIGGVILSEFAVPVAFILWLATSIGLM